MNPRTNYQPPRSEADFTALYARIDALYPAREETQIPHMPLPPELKQYAKSLGLQPE